MVEQPKAGITGEIAARIQENVLCRTTVSDVGCSVPPTSHWDGREKQPFFRCLLFLFAGTLFLVVPLPHF